MHPHLPDDVVLHVPHDSVTIPADVREQFVLDDDALLAELMSMTDHHTLALFAGERPRGRVVRAPVSRLVVDVERFADDDQEAMARCGMGAVYARCADGRPLRRALAAAERDALLRRFYRPHHEALEATVSDALARHGRCLVIDCHSFPHQALPYEGAAPGAFRPDICVGTDAFHTDDALRAAFVSGFDAMGWSVRVDDPFAGALVPAGRFRRDRRVAAVMVEINRRLYLREGTPARAGDFDDVAARVQRACAAAVQAWRGAA